MSTKNKIMKKFLFILRVAILLPFAIIGLVCGAIWAFILEGLDLVKTAYKDTYKTIRK